jgi:hypothetical protein
VADNETNDEVREEDEGTTIDSWLAEIDAEYEARIKAEVEEWNEELAEFVAAVEEREKRRSMGFAVDIPELVATLVPAPDGPQTTVIAIPEYVLNLRKGAFQTNSFEYDNGGNTFKGFCLNAPYDYPDVHSLGYFVKIGPTGQALGELIVRPAAINGVAHKADSAFIKIAGADMAIRLTTHGIVSEPRDNSLQVYYWRNVAVPYPNGVLPSGGHGVFKSEQPPEPNPDPNVDYAEIERRVEFQVNRAIDHVTARTLLVIQNMIPKGLITLDMAMDGPRGSAIVYNQLRNTSYSGALDAINDSKEATLKLGSFAKAESDPELVPTRSAIEILDEEGWGLLDDGESLVPLEDAEEEAA